MNARAIVVVALIYLGWSAHSCYQENFVPNNPIRKSPVKTNGKLDSLPV